jgi:chromosome segregation ATPase
MASDSTGSAYDRTVLKDIAKRMMRPLTRRIGARVDARIQPIRRGLADVSDRIQPLQAEVEGVNKYLGPVVARVQTHDRLTRTHEEAIGKLHEQVTSINRYLPGVLNSISSQNAALREARRTENDLRDHLSVQRDQLAHAHKRIDELAEALSEQIGRIQERTEFIRREILFESVPSRTGASWPRWNRRSWRPRR